MRPHPMSALRAGTALLALMGLGACKNLDVPNYNAGSIELLNSPTPAVINNMATGLLIQARADQGGITEGEDVYARNSYNLDPSEVRSVTIPLIGPLDPTQGPASWSGPYATIQDAYLVIHALDKLGSVPPVGMTDAQKEGVRGFAKTMIAWEMHLIVRQTGNFGAPIDVDRPRSGNPDSLAPFVSDTAVYARIFKLLDEAYVHLTNAGPSFSFSLSSGFSAVKGSASFTTPTTFRQFNRALRARADVDVGDFTSALTDIGNSFINTTGLSLTTLDNGVYHIYSTLGGDVVNGLFDATGRSHLAHPSLQTDAKLKLNGQPDDRFIRKVASILPTTRTLQGVSSSWRFLVYNSLDAPAAWIRNEELILLRAEANLACTGGAYPNPACTSDAAARAAALADINIIRTVSGGLPATTDQGVDPGPAPLPFSNDIRSGDRLLDELLYNKRYTLVYEFGHRWVDLRRYGMLGLLPKQQPIHVVFTQRPIPSAECTARPAGSVKGCKTVQGL